MTPDLSKKPTAAVTSSRRVVRRTVTLYCEGSGGPGMGWTLSAKWVPQRGGGYNLWHRADSLNGYRNVRLREATEHLSCRAICHDLRQSPELRVGFDLRDEVEVSGLEDFERDMVVATCASDEDNPSPDFTFLDKQSAVVLTKLRTWLGPLYGDVAEARLGAIQDLCARLELPTDLIAAGRVVGWDAKQPIHHLLGRLLRRWRDVGHDAFWSKVAVHDPKVLTWVGDKVLAPRTAAEWIQVLETWVRETVKNLPATAKYSIAPGLSEILGTLGGDDTTRVAVAVLSPGLLERFRETALRAVVANHTPGQPPKHPGFQGSNTIRWQHFEDIYRRLVAPPWFATGSFVRR